MYANNKKYKNTTKTSPLNRGLILILPFICIFGLLIALSITVIQAFAVNNDMYKFLFYHAADVVDSETEAPDTDSGFSSKDGVIEGAFPDIDYGAIWATLSVDGWEKYKEIPVYYGDDYNLLAKGAGMWQNSRFCGQNGKTVLSAHVTIHFRELEDTPVGTKVTMETIYGTYTYEVKERVIFTPESFEVLYPDDGHETLVLYTCYPYDAPSYIRSERLALVCEKITGDVFADYVK